MTAVGTRVRLKTDGGELGSMDLRDGVRFTGTVPHGTLGTYQGVHTTIPEEHWHWVETDAGKWVPVHRSQFEIV